MLEIRGYLPVGLSTRVIPFVALVRAGTEPVITPPEATMTATRTAVPSIIPTTGSLTTTGVGAAALASGATMAVAAAGHAAGIAAAIVIPAVGRRLPA